MLRLSYGGDICAVNQDIAVPSTSPCLPPLAVGNQPPSSLPLSRSLSVSPSLAPSFRQLGHLGLLERVSLWWNRVRQLFFQPQGHYLKSDKDSIEWTQGSWGRREKWIEWKGWKEKKKSVMQGSGLSHAGVLSSGGRGCWETNESSRHFVHTGDCLSIQIAVFRLAWQRAENFLRELITWQLSCLVQFTEGRGLIRAGFLFLSEEGVPALHPLFQLLSLCLHFCQPPSAHSPSLPLHRSSESDWNDSL